MKISCVVPMRDEAGNIERALRSIRRAVEHAGVDHEIIVVDNGSRDDGPRIARRLGAVVIDAPGLNVSAMRNLGRRIAEGDVLAFVDADMEMPEAWLDRWLERAARGHVEAFGLVHGPPPQAPWYARIWGCRTLAQRPDEAHVQYLPTSNLCVRRDDFDRVGGFDQRLRTGEDKDFTMRLDAAGVRLLSVSSPTAIHWGYEKSLGEWARKEFWRQGSHADLLVKSRFQRFRLLRFPLLAMGHWVADGLALAALVAGSAGLAVAIFAASLLPSLLVTGRHRLNRAGAILPGLWLMHWLRFHIGAAALLAGLGGILLRGGKS